MSIVDIIRKKRDGGELTSGEIQYFIDGIVSGEVADYQASAFCMAVYFRGMMPREIADLTMAMATSGKTMNLSEIPGVKVDKHSTGGVADTTTLVLAPLVASMGIPVAKMSGRGLGHTGGTIDKLESIPGYRTELTTEEFIKIVQKAGVSVIGQSQNLAPADKTLYALRDVTATIESIPLISSSIMSKKIAAGADGIVLDVKVGKGAFLKDLATARELAMTMVKIGESVNRRTVACLTDMNRPLGNAIGNSLEILEAVSVLKGEGPNRLVEVCLTLGAQMCILAKGKSLSAAEFRERLENNIKSGKALETFCRWIEAQGGDPEVVDRPQQILPLAEEYEVLAPAKGYIGQLDPLELGQAALDLGAGRKRKGDPIDPGVGIMLRRTTGDEVQSGEPLAVIYARSPQAAQEVSDRVQAAISIQEDVPAIPTLVYDVIS